MDGHHQHQPHHQGLERNQNHDHQNHDHSHGTEGRNEAEALDEVFIIYPLLLSEFNADDVLLSVFLCLLFFSHYTLVYVTKLIGNSNSNHQQRGPVS